MGLRVSSCLTTKSSLNLQTMCLSNKLKIPFGQPLVCLPLKKTIDHLNTVIRRKEEAVASFENSTLKHNYQDAKEEADILEGQKNEAAHQCQELLKSITVASAKIEAEEKKFWASGGRLGGRSRFYYGRKTASY